MDFKANLLFLLTPFRHFELMFVFVGSPFALLIFETASVTRLNVLTLC